MKKAVILLTTFIMMFCMRVVVYGYESDYDRNSKVGWLNVNGIDYNDKDVPQTVKGVTYNAVTNTLTLSNCNLNLAENEVEFIEYSGEIPLLVELKGDNTITGSSKDYRQNFIDCESYNNGNSSVTVSGGGTLNLVDMQIAECYILDGFDMNEITFRNVTINATSGIKTWYGNVNIEDSTIKINNKKFNDEGVLAGTDSPCGGNINIKNSMVEIKAVQDIISQTYYDYVFRCKSLNVNGLNIYAGTNGAKWKADANSLLPITDSVYNAKTTEDFIGYVLITSDRKSLPDISNAKDNHTSVYSKGAKTATYFATGHTGDKVCKICGKVVSSGSVLAKKKPEKPSVKSGKKKITVKYKKVSGATGFQIRYKKAKGKWVTKKYLGNKSCSKTFKKLKKGKKYSVQIRFVSGKNYSVWSETKVVKVK